jgi:hypothetical protein
MHSSEAASRQYKVCTEHLQNLMDRLDQSSSNSKYEPITLEEKMNIIRMMTLCALENPTFRQRIGTSNHNIILKTIISLLDEANEGYKYGNGNEHPTAVSDAAAAAAAVAGESIWILSFNNKHNHEYFVQNGAIPKMARIIETRGGKNNHYDILSVMWAAAALQNLAASYCHTESGHCWWEYNDVENLHLHQRSPLAIDGSEAAEMMVASDEFVQQLNRMVCRGPMSDSDALWPSLATIHDTMTPKLSTWAVTGLLKNLSLYHNSEHAAYRAKRCLCFLEESEDWLVSTACNLCIRLGVH